MGDGARRPGREGGRPGREGERPAGEGELTWVEVEGGRLPMLASGTEDGPPVVVLPGLTDGLMPISEKRTREAFPPPPPPLRGFRVRLMSYRHPLPSRPSTADLARDAIVLLERLDPPVVLTGHSMGGMVAQLVAAERPDLVRQMVLSSTLPSADEVFAARLRHWDELITSGRWRAFYRDALTVSFTGAARLRRRLALRLSPLPDVDHLVARHLGMSHASRTHDATDVLGAIRAPTLVLGGARDPLTRPERARELAAAIPDASAQIWDGVAHGLPEQAGERYTRALVEFLDPPPPQPSPGAGPDGSTHAPSEPATEQDGHR